MAHKYLYLRNTGEVKKFEFWAISISLDYYISNTLFKTFIDVYGQMIIGIYNIYGYSGKTKSKYFIYFEPLFPF